MPTPVLIDGFEHQTLSTNGTGIWSNIVGSTGISIDTTNQRTGAAALKVAQNGSAATYAHKPISSQVLVGSLYIRATAAPSVNSLICAAPGPTNMPQFWLTTAGRIRAAIGGSGAVDGPIVTDGNWHLLDFRFRTDTTTFTIEWSVDGAAQTTSTRTGQTATNMTAFRLGSGTPSHTATCWYDDLVLSYTSADYPIGPHKVLALVPNAETQGGGSVGDLTITGGTLAWEVLDEWPADTSTYVAQTTASGSSYRAVAFQETTETTIWGVMGYLAYFASAASPANDGITRIVDQGGATLTDIYSGDMSETSLFYKSAIIAAPSGGWTQTKLNGVRCRIGFSTTVSPEPRWSALMLQYAVPEPVVDVTISVPIATATAAGLASAQRSTLLPPQASATAGGTAPILRSTVIAPQAVATAVSLAPGIIIGPVTVIAPQATAGAAALTPGLASSVLPPAAAAAAVGLAPVLRVDVTVPLATATATASPPSLFIGFIIQAPVAQASASALAPALTVSVPAPLATATSSALAPTPGALLLPPLAAATAAALAPSLAVRVAIPLATATAAALAPNPFIASVVHAPLASATAAALAPNLAQIVQAVVADATAVALVDGVYVLVLAPQAAAGAVALVPTLHGVSTAPASWWQKPRYSSTTRDALRRHGMPSWRG
jgi:hypothetical protein